MALDYGAEQLLYCHIELLSLELKHGSEDGSPGAKELLGGLDVRSGGEDGQLGFAALTHKSRVLLTQVLFIVEVQIGYLLNLNELLVLLKFLD